MFFSLFATLICNYAQAVPLQINQQGRLLNNDGEGLAGSNQMVFMLYDSEQDGNIYWSETLTVEFYNGYYSVILGTDEEVNPLDDSTLSQYPLFIELKINGEALSPRHPLTSIPYAQIAGVAESVDGGVVNASEINIGGQPVVDGDGNWVGETASVDFVDLTNRPQGLDDGDDDSLTSLNCAQGEIVGWDGLAWICTSDNALSFTDIENHLLNTSIELNIGSTVGGQNIVTNASDSDSLGALSCLNDAEVARYDLALNEWYCDSDIDTTLSSSDVLSYVDGQQINLGASSQVDGNNILTTTTILEPNWLNIQSRPPGLDDGDDDNQLDQVAVLGYVQGQNINLGSGSQLGSDNILTDTSILQPNWSDIQGRPQGLDDGDDDNQLDQVAVLGYVQGQTINLGAGSQVDGDGILTEASPLDWGQIINPPQNTSNTTISTTAVTLNQNQEQVITPSGSSYSISATYLDTAKNLWLPVPLSTNSGMCEICGDGSDGDYLAYPIDSPAEVHVTLNSGTYNYSSFTIPTNVVLDIVGTEPLYINVSGKVEIRGTLNLSGGDAQCSYLGTCPGGEAGAGGSTGGSGGYGSQVPSESGTILDWNREDLFFGENLQGGTGGNGDEGRYHYSWYPQCNHYGAGGGGGGGALKIIAQSIEITNPNGIDVSGGQSLPDTTVFNSCGSQNAGTDGSGGSVWLIGGRINLHPDGIDVSGSNTGTIRIDSSAHTNYSGDYYSVLSQNTIHEFSMYEDLTGNITFKNNIFDSVDVRITLIESD